MFKPVSSFLQRTRWLAPPAWVGKQSFSKATLPTVFECPHRLRAGKVARRSCALAILALLWILSARTWAEQLPMRLYTTEDGLWSSFINHMMRDSRGFIWFCTRDGLSRFDGYGFTN
jgi:hypothetical protein